MDTIKGGADAMHKLADELDGAYIPPFTACSFDEHWEVIERVLNRLVNCAPTV